MRLIAIDGLIGCSSLYFWLSSPLETAGISEKQAIFAFIKRLTTKEVMQIRLFRKTITFGYILIAMLIGSIACTSFYEWRKLETLEEENRQINIFRLQLHDAYVQMIELSLLGETILEWDEDDLEYYRSQRMAMDSLLCRLKVTYPSERIDSLRFLLKDKEEQMRNIAQVIEQQAAINKKIAGQEPVIAHKSTQEQPSKPKRKGFLGLFGKKEKPQQTSTTAMLYTLNRDVIAKQRAQSKLLSEHADSLATRNGELNRQLQELISQMDAKVHCDLQKREIEIMTMREKSFMLVGGMTAIVMALLFVSYIIIHYNNRRINRYKKETSDLISELEKTASRNKTLIASRKKVVHTLTHELRTPLTAIIGYTGLMEKECNSEKSIKFIQSIRLSSDRMREMLNSLLNFFRLDNGKEQPNFSPCRISTITHTLETEFMPIAMNKGLVLAVNDCTDALVLTDKERILQIGNNLLSNAIKFTENGSVSLTTDYRNDILTMTVEDTGTGMTEEEQQRVFDAFERLSNAATQDGFGLGLSIVHRIVAMLGGTIRLESEKGKGSRFIVDIPMQTADKTPEQNVANYVRYNNSLHNIIVIDNDEVLLQMIKEMYAQEGVRCDTCNNVAELMEMVRRKNYCLLLTDLNMPEINGFELLELLRSSNVGNSRTIPVVVTTASGSCSEEELLTHGFSGCLFKPFSISELMEVSNRYATKGKQDDKPDFSSLLSYGNEVVMLDKLIIETEKEMLAVKEAGKQKNLQELDALTHHLRSSWEILHADMPLRKLYKLLHNEGSPDYEMLNYAIKAVLDKGEEIIRLAKEERRTYNG